MEVGTVSLIISLLVAATNFWKFWEDRSGKKEEKMAVFAKVTDVKEEMDAMNGNMGEMAALISKLKEKVSSCAPASQLNGAIDHINGAETKLAVLEERVNHSIDGLEKIEVKLDKIIERL